MGYLVPLYTEEVLPGDTFRCKTSLYCRIAPLVAPVMHEVDVRLTSWYVPNRIIWSAFDEWITGADEVSTMPTVTADTSAKTELMDHMGMEPIQGVAVQALPFRAYNMVWNEFFRDIDHQTERDQDDMTVARVNWESDYFTKARATPQQGDAATIPITGVDNLPISGLIRGNLAESNPDTVFAKSNSTGAFAGFTPSGELRNMYSEVGDFAYAEFAGATGGIDINAFRQAMALQRFAEARSRFGDRYVDYLRYLGINPTDGRLSRPEFLGGGSNIVSFSEVLATAEGSSTDVGDMFGHGIAGVSSRPWRKMFEEHGWVMVLVYVRPRSQYSNGIPRKFRRTDPMDYWQKELEILPWQEIKQTEIYGAGDPDITFGWTPRFEEYRTNFSFVSGSMRPGEPENDWHMSREFSSAPTLNGSFHECTPTDRIYASNTVPELVISSVVDCTAKRLVGRGELEKMS